MTSLASVTIGNADYPVVNEPRCKTCAHPKRSAIEREVVRGRGYRAILRELGIGEDLSVDNVGSHISNGHLPIAAPAVQRLAQERMAEVRESVAPMVQDLANHLTFAHRVLSRVQERLEAEDLEPTISDGLAAAKLIASASVASGGADVAEYEAYAIGVFEEARVVMSAEQFSEFCRRVDRRQPLPGVPR